MAVPIQTLIVEDEPIARRHLRSYLELMEGVSVLEECADVSSAVAACRMHRPNLIFLDVTLAASNGFDLLKEIPADQRPAIIVVTASAEHACQAFNSDAVDFLLKPFTRERLFQAVEKARKQLCGKTQTPPSNQTKDRDFITVKCDRRFVRIRLAEIHAVLAERHSCKVLAGKEVYRVPRTLGFLEEQLSQAFVRISRGAIINAQQIRAIHPKSHGDSIVELGNGQSYVVSRLYRARLERALSIAT